MNIIFIGKSCCNLIYTLACLRALVKGMSVGGQLPASLIYTVEMRPKEHWGFYGALVMMAGKFFCFENAQSCFMLHSFYLICTILEYTRYVSQLRHSAGKHCGSSHAHSSDG